MAEALTGELGRVAARIAAALDPEKILGALEEKQGEESELDRCKADPVYWIRNYGWLFDPKAPVDRRIFRFELWPKQERAVAFFLDGYRQQDDRILNKAREIGATWLWLHLIYWLWLFEPGFLALLISRAGELVDDDTIDSLFGKIMFIHSQQPAFLQPRVFRRRRLLKNLDNGSKITGRATSRGVGRSTRQGVVLVDEAAHINTNAQSAIKTSLQTVGSSTWWISTPRGRGNEFAFMVVSYRGTKRYLELDWTTNPTKARAWFDGLLIENGGGLTWDQRAQEHGCSLAGVSGERIFKVEDRDRITYTDEELPERGRELLFVVVPMDFGTGVSWTVAVWILVDYDNSPHPEIPLMKVDLEKIWSRTQAEEIGAEMVDAHTGTYSDNYFFTGDPSGTNPESDQDSWQTRLNDAGVPLRCLPAEYNSHDILNDAGLSEVQSLLDAGLLQIHATRCPISLEALESWEYDIPEGLDVRFLSRETIRPRKDSWSHICQAIEYGVTWLMRNDPRESDLEEIARDLPVGSGNVLADLYARLTKR
jgi:hypothetical protein